MMTEYISSEQIYDALANLPQLVFEVTDACNLKCKYCYYGEFYEEHDARENSMLPIDKAIRLIDYLNQYWNSPRCTSANTYMYISFYGGEALMNMEFVKAVVAYIDQLDCPRRKFRFSMTTNAILLHRHMDYLVEKKFNLLISLDGNEYNHSYRVDHSGRNSFSRVIRNVDLLQERYPEYFRRYVNFNSVLHNRNSVADIYTFIKQRYDKIPSISELNNSGIRDDKKEDYNATYRNSMESLHQAEHYEEIENDMFIKGSSYRVFSLYLQRYSGYHFNDYTDLFIDRKQLRYMPTGTCIPFSRKLFVTVNGKILPCERIGQQHYMGTITDNEILLDIEHITYKYNVYLNKMQKQCSTCKNQPGCTQCLYNLENLENHPVCHGYMNDKLHKQVHNAQMHFLHDHPDAYRKIMEETITI